ncbi:hypothetical protein ACD578_26900 (plasmid) [Microvirga sp. RSM25]|uniref:hypothetical protein n=1 Tax=Microvirga sp. RSM25 TaxID=3273802 RepID=UPI00384EBC45
MLTKLFIGGRSLSRLRTGRTASIPPLYNLCIRAKFLPPKNILQLRSNDVFPAAVRGIGFWDGLSNGWTGLAPNSSLSSLQSGGRGGQLLSDRLEDGAILALVKLSLSATYREARGKSVAALPQARAYILPDLTGAEGDELAVDPTWVDDPEAECVTVAISSTFDTEAAQRVLLADQWLHVHGGGDRTSAFGREVRQHMRAHFCPDDPIWQEAVLFRGRQVLRQTLSGLTRMTQGDVGLPP